MTCHYNKGHMSKMILSCEIDMISHASDRFSDIFRFYTLIFSLLAIPYYFPDFSNSLKSHRYFSSVQLIFGLALLFHRWDFSIFSVFQHPFPAVPRFILLQFQQFFAKLFKPNLILGKTHGSTLFTEIFDRAIYCYPLIQGKKNIDFSKAKFSVTKLRYSPLCSE